MAEAKDKSILRNGIQSEFHFTFIPNNRSDRVDFANHPITSRAHLLDIPSYLSKHTLPALNPFDTSKIPLSVLKGCADDEKLEIVPGDILIVHTGFAEAYLGQTEEQKKALVDREVRAWCGVESSQEVLRWHWECGFSAVATDT